MKLLIVNADDFGLTQGVTDGICLSHRDGIVTSTTCMANMPWARYAVERAEEFPSLGVGIHLVLTAGRPVLPASEVPSLVDGTGRFRKDLNHLRFFARRDEIRREWRAQIEAFLALGRRPTHLDSHHNTHLHPDFIWIALELAKEYAVPAIRLTRPADLPWKGSWFNLNPMQLVYSRYTKLATAAVEESGVRAPDLMLGLLHPKQELSAGQILEWLKDKGEGIAELVCHPGLVDDELRGLSSMVERRERELRAVCEPRLRPALDSAGVKLVNFGVFTE